jgi:hypothetical protein
MTIDPKPGTNRTNGSKWALRGGATFVVIALLLGGLLVLVDFEEERPDYYEPARIPITEAAAILSETSAEENELVQQLQSVHSRLGHAIDLLGQAERLDPADKRKIETLQVRLRALGDSDRMLKTDPMELQRAYHELTRQLNALAEKLAQPAD